MNKKVLVIWTGNQWQQYIDFFLKNKYIVEGMCKSKRTQEYIQTKKNIKIYTEEELVIWQEFDMIVLALPSEIQWHKALNILESGFTATLLIESPVSLEKNLVERLQKYENVIFFIEEYYTLLSRFLQKAESTLVHNLHIKLYISQEDYENEFARMVSYMHVRHNFLWKQEMISDIELSFHESEKIFYEISFQYRGKNIFYNFSQEKYLLVWDTRYDDPFCFDMVLALLLSEEKNLKPYYVLEN